MRKTLFLKKRKELIANGVLPEKSKTLNFELFDERKEVLLTDGGDKLTEFYTWTYLTEYSKSLESRKNEQVLEYRKFEPL